jgi:hypothetical protein
MKRRAFSLAFVCALASQACGDGIGRPIRGGPTEGASGAGGSGGGATDGGGGAMAADAGDVPDNVYCKQAANWPVDLVAQEDELFASINKLRSGMDNGCGPFQFGGAPPLAPSPALRCSARLHAADMAVRGFFSQTNPDGVGPDARMSVAGFAHSAAAEDVGRGSTTRIGPELVSFPPEMIPGETMNCALGDPLLQYAGVGHYGDLWAIDVANPSR